MKFGPKKGEVTGEQIKLHHEELQNCFFHLIYTGTRIWCS
jgi:hypothetical protein